MGAGGKEGVSGIVMEDVYEDVLQNLGGRLVLMLMRAGILVGWVVVVGVEVMVVVAVVVISFSEKRCLSVTELECLRVGFGLVGGDLFDFGGDFVAVVGEMEVDDLELEVGAVVRVVWSCVNGELYFLWRLARISLEGKMFNAGEHPFGMVMQADFLMEFFFFDGGCLGKAGSKK